MDQRTATVDCASAHAGGCGPAAQKQMNPEIYDYAGLTRSPLHNSARNCPQMTSYFHWLQAETVINSNQKL